MSTDDYKQREKEYARNDVEEFVYEMKDKLADNYSEFVSKQVCGANACRLEFMMYCTLRKKRIFLINSQKLKNGCMKMGIKLHQFMLTSIKS